MAQELNTQRVLTIAGSVALVALTAYGVWKWNKTDVVNEDDKKKKSRQVAKAEKQSQASTQEKEEPIKTVEQDLVEQVLAQAEQTLAKVEQAVLETEQAVLETEQVVTETEQVVADTKQVIAETEQVNAETEQVVIDNKQVAVDTTKPEIKEESDVTKQEIFETVIETEKVTEPKEEDYVVIAKREESQSCATSSTDETDVWTPEHESDNKNNTPEANTTTTTIATEEYIWKADVTSTSNTEDEKDWASSTIVTCSKLSSDAPVFVPRQQVVKKNPKKRLSRAELIEQQRQNHTPHAKARCSHWPRCTNKNCKFWHPFRDCREGETCPFGNKCMFIHPSDYVEPPRVKKNQTSDEEDQLNQQEQFQFTA